MQSIGGIDNVQATQRLIEFPFDAARKIKGEAFRKSHPELHPGDFLGDPFEEFDAEMLDAMNYLDEIEKRGFNVSSIKLEVRFVAERVRSIYRSTCHNKRS